VELKVSIIPKTMMDNLNHSHACIEKM